MTFERALDRSKLPTSRWGSRSQHARPALPHQCQTCQAVRCTTPSYQVFYVIGLISYRGTGSPWRSSCLRYPRERGRPAHDECRGQRGMPRFPSAVFFVSTGDYGAASMVKTANRVFGHSKGVTALFLSNSATSPFLSAPSPDSGVCYDPKYASS